MNVLYVFPRSSSVVEDDESTAVDPASQPEVPSDIVVDHTSLLYMLPWNAEAKNLRKESNSHMNREPKWPSSQLCLTWIQQNSITEEFRTLRVPGTSLRTSTLCAINIQIP